MDPLRFGPTAIEPIGNALRAATNLAPAATETGGADFMGAMKKALDMVNSSQQQAADLAKGFQLNQPDVSLEETMIALQKANVSFQAVVQVRNKLVSAYHDIMNMQV